VGYIPINADSFFWFVHRKNNLYLYIAVQRADHKGANPKKSALYPPAPFDYDD
jgi:hypothetical protein